MNKKIIIGACVGVLLILGIVLAVVLFNKKEPNKQDNKQEEKQVENNKLETIDLSKVETEAEVIDLIKLNIVKIVNKTEKGEIIGTGFFIEDGFLVTNSHVVDIKGNIKIYYSDGTEDAAKLISNDIDADVALLHVDSPKVKALKITSSSNIKVTNNLYAVGYSLNLEGEATTVKGILSAKRKAKDIEYLQIDASLENGSSGGPLLTTSGELVGMNSLATSNSSFGIAVSSDSLNKIISNLKETIKVNYLNGKRQKNNLSDVLKEIGYSTDDIYDDDKFFEELTTTIKSTTTSSSVSIGTTKKKTTTKKTNQVLKYGGYEYTITKKGKNYTELSSKDGENNYVIYDYGATTSNIDNGIVCDVYYNLYLYPYNSMRISNDGVIYYVNYDKKYYETKQNCISPNKNIKVKTSLGMDVFVTNDNKVIIVNLDVDAGWLPVIEDVTDKYDISSDFINNIKYSYGCDENHWLLYSNSGELFIGERDSNNSGLKYRLKSKKKINDSVNGEKIIAYNELDYVDQNYCSPDVVLTNKSLYINNIKNTDCLEYNGVKCEFELKKYDLVYQYIVSKYPGKIRSIGIDTDKEIGVEYLNNNKIYYLKLKVLKNGENIIYLS